MVEHEYNRMSGFIYSTKGYGGTRDDYDIYSVSLSFKRISNFSNSTRSVENNRFISFTRPTASFDTARAEDFSLQP